MSKHHHKKNSQSVSGAPVNDEEQVRLVAYELYLRRGMEDGHDLEDWFKAEDELSGRKAKAAAA